MPNPIRTFTPLVPALFWAMILGVTLVGQAPEDTANDPALDPTSAMASFRLSPGLAWSSLLSDPEISQPLQSVFDSHGRLWVVEYRQYPNPEGLRPLSRDKHWRIVYDSVPQPPGRGGLQGLDRISIHEDKDNDGTYESHRIFVDGLNIATAVAPDANGAWVLNPPYLLYYSDHDHDLAADGAPEVHLVGFGLEDTHSVVNSLCMGPDGWLYAAQGSTVSAAIKPYGSDIPPIQSLGQAIWRYHPVTRQYEIFAEGGGNSFGVAFNDRGEVFSGHNGGDTRGFHYYQGGYYRKGFSKHGSLSNPHSYGYLNPMQHDPIPRFTHTMLFTESTALASLAPKSMLAVDPLHGKLIQTELLPVGSTYATKDVADTVASTDKWFRPVAISDGPDGAAYVCDWYDSVVAHIYAFEGKLDRDRGRVYRLAPKNVSNEAPAWDPVLAHGQTAESLDYLVKCLNHPYRWQRWQARWRIAQHPMRNQMRETLTSELIHHAAQPNLLPYTAIELLWTVHACGWIRDTIPFALTPNEASQHDLAIAPQVLMEHPDPMVRSWTVRLVCDDAIADPEVTRAVAKLASIESDSSVLCQIVCSAKRLPASDAIFIMKGVLANPAGANDPFLPLLSWWTIEHHMASHTQLLEHLVQDHSTWQHPIARNVIYPNLVRRWSSIGTPPLYDSVSEIFRQIAALDPSLRDESSRAAQEAFEQAFVGRSLSGVPDSVIDAMIALGQPSLTLQVRRGDESALAEAAKRISDPTAADRLRMQLARLAGELPHTRLRTDFLDALLAVVQQTQSQIDVRSSALSALAGFDSIRIAESILDQWSTLPSELRPTAGAVLASRPAWTSRWIERCEQQQLQATDMPPEAIRAMRMHPDDLLQKRISQLYPEFAAIDLAAANNRSREAAKIVLEGNGDPYRGKKLYRELCGRCHRLFDDGGAVGPELTGYQRDQLETLLRNIIAPSLEIREGYQMVRVLTSDSMVLSGFIESDSGDQVHVRGIDGQLHTLDKGDIDTIQPQILSLMPEGLIDKLDPTQLRDLMAYLRSSQPLNDGT